MTNAKTFQITNGFEADQKERVVELFWEAFKDKLYLVMQPEDKALGFLNAVVDPDHAICAVALDGTVIGVAGFKTKAGSFIGGSLADVCKCYGVFGGLWRAATLLLLERSLEADTLLMDGIFVSPEARGRGVGTALLSAIKAEAQFRGCEHVRLDVIDTNPRARALYLGQGFQPGATSDLGPLRHVFGFERATTMTFQVT